MSRDARDVSRALFGNMAFAEVVTSADAILTAGGPSGTVTTRQVAAATGCADSVVRPVMQRLVVSGLLTAVPRTGPSNSTQRFARSEPKRWLALLALVAVVDSSDLTEQGVASQN